MPTDFNNIDLLSDQVHPPVASGQFDSPSAPPLIQQPEREAFHAQLFNDDGSIDEMTAQILAGDVGQKLGYTPARDEGFLREFGKGFKRGGVQFGQSIANTFGANQTSANLQSFLDTNRQLYDSDRKDTWSYIANVAGSQISENLPMLAATIGAGLLTGGAGSAAIGAGRVAGVARTAAQIAATRTLVAKSAGATMTALMQWGNNLDELRERLPNMSESSLISLNMFLTPLQSWLEVGLGAEARTASEIGKLGLGAELVKRAGMSRLKDNALKMGRLAKFRETFAGKWLGVGVEETFEELLQTVSMDALSNTFSTEKDWNNQEKWDGLVGKYKQLFQEAFIGGMALGVLPSTLNSYNNMAARGVVNKVLRDNPNAVAKVDAGGVNVNGVWIMNQKRQQDTLANFNAFFGNLGQGQLNPDPKKRTPVQKLFTTLFYNLASMKMDAETDPAKRAGIKAEDAVSELTILVAQNKNLGPELMTEISKPDATIESIASIVNKYDKKLGVTFGSVKDVVENGYARRNVEGLSRELENQLATDDDNEVVVGAFRTLGGVAAKGEKVVDAKKILSGDRVVPPSLLNKVAESAGDGFSRVLASGWIHNVVIRNAPPVSIKLEIDDVSGALHGTMFTAEEAKEQISEEAESGDGLTDTGLILAKTKLKLGRLQDSLRRIASWKKRSYVVQEEPVVAPVVEKPAVQPELPSTTPEDTAQRLKLLQDIKAEIAKIPVEDIVIEPSVAIEKFNERAAKATPKVEGAPIVEPAVAPVVDNTIAGQIASLEKEILTKVKGIKKSESPLAPAEVIRRKTEDYFKQFAPAAVGPIKILHEDGETGVGLYKQDVPLSAKEADIGRDTQLMAFLNGSDLGTIAHELAHHLVEQELLPNQMMDALRKNFIVGVDKDRRLNQAEKENIANSFLQYVMQGKLPANADVAAAFASMKSVISGSMRSYFVKTGDKQGYFLNQFQSAETDQPVVGTSKLVLKPDVNQFFQSIFANVTEDKIAKQYGHALRDSLLNGRVSDKYYFDEVQSIKTKMDELSSLSKQTPDSVAKRILVQYGDNFGNKTDLSKLDSDERYVLDRILEDELKAINPERIKVGQDKRILWEGGAKLYNVMVDGKAVEISAFSPAQARLKVGLRNDVIGERARDLNAQDNLPVDVVHRVRTLEQGTLFERQRRSQVFVKKALIDTAGNIYEAIPGETQHFQIETRAVKGNPKLALPGSLTSGYLTKSGVFVEALNAEKDGLFSLEKQLRAERSPLGFYSQVEEVVANAPQEKMPASDWMNWIQKQPGVKKEELDYLDIGELLPLVAKDGLVAKDRLVELIRHNNVKMEEVVKKEGRDIDILRRPSELVQAGQDAAIGIQEILNKKKLSEKDWSRIRGLQDELRRIGYNSYITNAKELIIKEQAGEAKWTNQSRPEGGKHYKEFVFTIPGIEERTDSAHWTEKGVVGHVRTLEYGDTFVPFEIQSKPLSEEHTTNKERAKLEKTIYVEKDPPPNELPLKKFYLEDLPSEVRAKWKILSKATADNIERRKDNFLRAISDSGNELVGGREALYNFNPDLAVFQSLTERIDPSSNWRVRDENGKVLASYPEGEYKTAEEAKISFINEQFPPVSEAVRSLPFKNSWPMVFMKRMLKYAVDNGFSKLAWSTGKMQIDLNETDLRRNVDEISWTSLKMDEDTTFKEFKVSKDGKVVMNFAINNYGKVIRDEGTPSELYGKSADEILGKAIGKRVVEEDSAVLKGNDLSIGGEFFKFLYDQWLVSEVGKYVKKWGATVGETKIETEKGIPSRGTISDVYDTLKRAKDWASIAKEREGFSNVRIEEISPQEIAERELGKYKWRVFWDEPSTPPKIETLHSVDITPAMSESIKTKGQPYYEMQKRRDASRMSRPKQNSFFHNLFVDEKIKNADERQEQATISNHEFLQGLGFPADVTQLTDEQVRVAIEEKQNEQSPADSSEVEIPSETKEMSEKLEGTRVTSMDEESFAGRISSGFVRFGRKASELIMDAKTLVRFITNNAPIWSQYITEPLSRISNVTENKKNEFYKIFRDKVVQAGADLSPLYENFDVDKFRFTGSVMLDIYFMSNYGTELDNNSMTKFKAAHPDFFPEKIVNGEKVRSNELVQDIVDRVKNDENLVKIGAVMQEMNSLYFDRAATIKESLSGEKPPPIIGSYTSERTKGGLFISNEEKDIASQLQIFVPGLGNISMEPDALKHRGDVATGEYNLDSFGKFITHIESLINYEAKARDIHRMLSSIENPTMRDAFLSKFGSDDYRQALIKLLRREMSSTGTLKGAAGLPLEGSVSYLTNKAYTAFLSWNPMPILTQLTTVFTALSALGINAAPKLASNFTNIMRQFLTTQSLELTDAYKLADRLSPSIFSELFPKASRDSVRQLLEQGRFSIKGMKTYVKIEQMGMKPMAASDMTLRLATYQTAYEIKLSELKYSGKTESEMSNIARTFAEETISKSHNPSSRSERGLLQSESSAFLKSSLAFTSQPFAMMKMFITDTYLPLLTAFQKSGLIGVGKEIGSNKDIWRKVALAGILPGLALGAIGRRRLQKNMEEVLKDALIMGLGNSIPVIGQLLWASAVMGWSGKGRGFGGIYGQFMSNITDTVTDILKGDASWKTVKSARRTATLLAGIPDWPIRVVENLTNVIYVDGGDFDGKTLREAMLGKTQD